MEAKEAAKSALLNVLEAVAGEKLMVVCDDELKPVGDAFAKGALDMGLWTRLVILETTGVRKEIPAHLQEIFATQKPDIFINLLRGASDETPFRIMVTRLETRRRTRLGHCPGVTLDMLTNGALALRSSEYKKMQNFSNHLIQKLVRSTEIHLTNPAGTDMKICVRGREFFTDVMMDWKEMKWMNLPVGEVIVAPIENEANGVLVCDMGVGGIGKIKSPVKIEVKNGKAMKPSCKNKAVLAKVTEAFKTDPMASRIGEFAMGINPAARFSEEFLEAEKMVNTAHIAFGNNMDFPGGKNTSDNHMDFLLSKPTIKAKFKGGKCITIMKDGEFTL